MRVFVSVLAIAVFVHGGAQASPSWSDVYVSSSSSSVVSTGTPWTGETTLYLLSWADAPGPSSIDMLQFSFAGTLAVTDLIPVNGLLNLGTLGAPSLLFPTCEFRGYSVVAELRVLDATGAGGTVCLADSWDTGRNCARFCPTSPGHEEWMANYTRGFSSNGSAPCQGYSQSCPNPVSVDATAWGRVKAAYR